MLRLITSLLLICTAASLNAQSTEKEKVVRAYYSGFERHTWNDVAAQFAEASLSPVPTTMTIFP